MVLVFVDFMVIFNLIMLKFYFFFCLFVSGLTMFMAGLGANFEFDLKSSASVFVMKWRQFVTN